MTAPDQQRAEVPEDKPARPVTVLFDQDNPDDRIGLGMGPALRARYGPIGGRSPFDTSPDMPGLPVRYDPVLAAQAREGLTRQARRFVPRREDYGPHPVLEPTPEGTYTRPAGAVDWRAEWAEFVDDLGRPLRSLQAWWRAKQAQRDQRMGVEQ